MLVWLLYVLIAYVVFWVCVLVVLGSSTYHCPVCGSNLRVDWGDDLPVSSYYVREHCTCGWRRSRHV